MAEEVGKIFGLKYRVAEVDDIRRKHPFDANPGDRFPLQFFLFSSQINQEHLEAQEHPEILLCDRSILDHWADWKWQTQKIEKAHSTDEDQILASLYRFWVRKYDLLIWIRGEIKTLFDRFPRESFDLPSMEELRGIEEQFTRIIHTDELPILEVWNEHSLDECAQQIVRGISERFLTD